MCPFEAGLMGGKVRTKVSGRPRRVLEGLAGCEAYSEPENKGEQRGKGEGKTDTTVSNTSYRRLQGSLGASLPAEQSFLNYEFKPFGLVCLVWGLFLIFTSIRKRKRLRSSSSQTLV